MNLQHLPVAIRIRIYIEAGLVTNEAIDWSPDQTVIVRSSRYRNFGSVVPRLETSIALLLTCRWVHDEVFPIFFSTNIFCITSLHQLPVSARAAIRHVHVTLRRYDAMLDWPDTAADVGPQFQPDCLELSLACNDKTGSRADQIFDGLSYFPRLRRCELLLGLRPNRSLGRRAREAALRATGYAMEHEAAFGSFMRLPVELRLRVPEHTDLVLPDADVHWNSNAGYGSWPGIVMNPNWSDIFQSISCTRDLCDSQKGRYGLPIFCNRRHAAYSPACNCWLPPTSLFRVCRKLTDEARRVFFACNGFKISNPSDFFGSVLPSPALSYLRLVRVDIDFDEDGECENWRVLVERLREQGNFLPYLEEISIIPGPSSPSWPEFPSSITDDDFSIFSKASSIDVVRGTVELVWPISEYESTINVGPRRLKVEMYWDDAAIAYFYCHPQEWTDMRNHARRMMIACPEAYSIVEREVGRCRAQGGDETVTDQNTSTRVEGVYASIV
ncbi:hypothetical protein F4778DRAFT_716834 [Xylariomycetidae sp. FL2044]|nr:hypothetical protein F4778DRAFT_716834 [Xylariomycetidae sp. FL2044]